MKILHTSDWHLGHRLHEQSQHEEQALFLEWLLNYINENEISVLLVSGDIFDTGVPPTQSQKLYYDFLVRLRQSSCKHVVITGGNHDAPGNINAPKELLAALHVHVIGKATDNVDDEILQLKVNDEKVIVAAVPYLRDQDIRRAVAGESFEDIGERYKKALVSHYTEVGDGCDDIKTEGVPVIGMGHLFAIGGSTSESEQRIYVGNLGDIGAEDFPDIFDYIALGHLHRPQKVAGRDDIRYSGSPNVLSFSEIGYDKKVVEITTNNGEVTDINDVTVPGFRKVARVKGVVSACIEELKAIDEEEHDLTPWIEVVIDNTNNTKIESKEINEAVADMKLEVLKITLKNDRDEAGLDALIEHAKHIKELAPIDVFKMKCDETGFNIDENPEIFDAFNEALQIAQGN
ncbi:exonuclease subunit SbcD [Puteibacter caeruleilacunae]|nr:exonuclease subunit SbcD [Puteibacter caeruleilacunae]